MAKTRGLDRQLEAVFVDQESLHAQPALTSSAVATQV